MTLRKIIIVLALLLLALPAAAQDDPVNPAEMSFSGTPEAICEEATPAVDPESRIFDEAGDVLEDGVDYRAIMCTSAGPVYIDLLEDYAPVTVNNFVFLAEQNYYNNTIFHRVIADFMAQGGDPRGDGTGGPGYAFEDEFVPFLTFDGPGTLAMANSGANTNGSQFFITTAPTTHLNYRHTIFGDVLQGQDNVENIELRDPQSTLSDVPTTTLDTVVIIRDPSSVETTYTPDSEPFSAEQVMGELNQLLEEPGLPENIQQGLDEAETIETAEVVAAAPDDVQDAYETLLTENGHEFRVRMRLTSTDCSPQFFEELVYTMDAFESAEAAEAALASETLTDLNVAQGYTATESDLTDTPTYTASVASCAEDADETTAGRIYLTRGRYLVTLYGALPPAAMEQVGVDALGAVLEQNGLFVFEPYLKDTYRAELRQ
jgi:cyclophilin family peptidyl-prolyl cis-trans isomerase